MRINDKIIHFNKWLNFLIIKKKEIKGYKDIFI